ncbi:MAG: hypothetical protein MJ067_06125, partial [Oscillospiraceae bacterium]|nr:hypothetical protein [Oscillospiraceae bacterium]
MKKSGKLFFYSIPLVLIIIAVGLYIGLKSTEPETAAVALPEPENTDEREASPSQDTPEFIELNADTVSYVLRTLARPQAYKGEVIIKRYFSGGEGSESISFFKSGDKMLFISDAENQSRKKTLIIGGQKSIAYPDSQTKTYVTTAGPYDEDCCRGFMSYDSLLSGDGCTIVDAGYDYYESDYYSGQIISVTFTGSALPYVYFCRVDLETGLPVTMDCYDGENSVYSVFCSSLELSSPEE